MKAIAMVAGVLLGVHISLAGTDCNAVLLFQCPYPCGATIQTSEPTFSSWIRQGAHCEVLATHAMPCHAVSQALGSTRDLPRGYNRPSPIVPFVCSNMIAFLDSLDLAILA